MRLPPILLVFVFALAACSSSNADGGDPPPATTTSALTLSCNGEEIAFDHSDLCIEPLGGVLGTATVLTQQPCTCPMIPAQTWIPTSISSSLPVSIVADFVQSTNTNNLGMCFDRPYNETADHTPVQSYPCSDWPAPSQEWAIRYLPEGDQLEAAWIDPASGKVVWSGQCLDVPDASKAPGVPLQMYACKQSGDPSIRNQILWFP